MRMMRVRMSFSDSKKLLLVVCAVLSVDVWQEALAEDAGPSLQVKVCARFRPLANPRRGPAGGQPVVLPLHQRLHLIRAQENCSHSEAQRILWEPRGGQSSPWGDAEVKTPQKKPESDENDVDNGSEKKGATSPSGYKALEGDEKVQACVVNLKPGLSFRQGSCQRNLAK